MAFRVGLTSGIGSGKSKAADVFAKLVDCDESQEIARAMARSQLSEEEVRRIMSATCSAMTAT